MADNEINYSEARQCLREAPALSIKQPWAELILQRRKTIELRKWITSKRGWMWLHTGKSPVQGGAEYFRLHNLFCGGFIGAFFLQNIESLNHQRWDDLRQKHLDPGKFQEGMSGWVIKHVLRLSAPVVAAGAMGVFSVDPSVRHLLETVRFDGEQ